MAANDISTLPTRMARQTAKLDIAQLKRQGYTLNVDGTVASGPDISKPCYRENNTYYITQLPTQYDENTVVDNPNPTGLIQGRPWAIYLGVDNPANLTEPDATAWVLIDGPLYNTPGNPGSGFIGGQSWRKMQPIGYLPYGRETYTYGDEYVRWNGSFWAYGNNTLGDFATSYDDVERPWLATWTNGFTGAKITSAYVKTTNYPAVP